MFFARFLLPVRLCFVTFMLHGCTHSQPIITGIFFSNKLSCVARLVSSAHFYTGWSGRRRYRENEKVSYNQETCSAD